MDGRPEFLFTWIGLAKIGVCSALINSNLDGKPLIHSLSVCGASNVIIGIEHCEKVNLIKSQLNENFNYFVYGGNFTNMISIDSSLLRQPNTNPPRSLRNTINANSNLFFIYTR